MGQNSSVDVGTSKLDRDKKYIIVDASDSCVSGVKLRSTGIIPISELIKQEKCSKNIQKIEQTYYNKKKSGSKQPKEVFKSKKGKPDFIETSFEDVPTRRQWVRVDSEPKKPFESDAVKIGLKKPSKTALKNDKQIGVKNGFQDKNRDHIKEHNKELNKEHNKEHNREGIQNRSRNTKREHTREKSRNAKQEHTREKSRHTKRETIREDARPSTRKEVRKNIGIGTADTLQRNNKIPEKKLNIDVAQSIKSILKNNVIEHRFKENATQTITTSYENVKQLYKRNDNEEKKRSRNKQPQQKQFKQHKKEMHLRDEDFEEESTHQFQTHELSQPKRKLRNYSDNLNVDTMILCAIPPEEYHNQWQTISNEGGRKLGRQPGRNYINRKLAGAYYSRKEKYVPNKNDVNSLNSYDMLPPSVTLLPTTSTSEEAIREHRKYVSAKEALESWKNLHTWKQHVKQFEKSRNDSHQNNFDVATQTLSHCPKNIVRPNRSNHYLPTIPAEHDDFIMPSEKHLYKDFIVKMEHCLQNHSRLCELNSKRNGEGKFTWVQDRYRRWHKISFDDFKK